MLFRSEQGRITTPSYKVKRIVQKPRDEWAVIENNHEPIIDKFDFETTQRVLAMDTRTAQAGQPVELFSGITYCGECGGAMIRKTVPYGKKKYVYYVCANHKERRACYPHSLRTEALENIVLEALQAHIQEVCDLEDLSKLADSAQLQQAKMRKLQARLDKKQEEIDRMHTLLRSLYENLADGILDQDEYKDLKKTYTQRREEAEQRAELLREEMDRESASMDTSWMEQFRHCRNIIALDRRLVVSLIVRVIIFRDKRVEIVYRWQNEFDLQRDLLRMAQAERQVG